MTCSSSPTTTSTVEMAQIADLNARLRSSADRTPITATDLGLDGASLLSERPAGTLPGTAVLDRLCWDGPPEYPYIHAHFSTNGGKTAPLIADIHTRALQQLSHRLRARHVWGVGSPDRDRS
jgi:hypothetical protein